MSNKHPTPMPGRAKGKSQPKTLRATRRALRKKGLTDSTRISVCAAPTAVGTRIEKRPLATSQCSGTLVASEVVVPSSGYGSNFQALVVNINPFLLGYFVGGATGGTGGVGSTISNRLSSMALCFSEFRFKKLVVRYVPSCPTSTSGSLLFAYEENINAGIGNALIAAVGTTVADNVRNSSVYQVYANSRSIESTVWEPLTWEVPCSRGWKQCDPFQAVGLYGVEASAGILNALMHDVGTATAPLGTVHLDYVVEFRSPTWAPGFAAIEDAITPTFTLIANTAGQAQAIKFNEVGVASTYASFFKGPIVIIPRSTLIIGSGPSTSIPAGQPVIAAVYISAAYTGYDVLALYASMADLTAGTYLQVSAGTTVAVNFEADVFALSSFGA